jgi:anti-sigma factor RsiW
MTDPFEHDDAAYVLGVLDAPERAAFEAHLATCPDCRQRVAEQRATAAFLELVPRDFPPAEPVPVPDTLLPGLLRRAARERRRRRLVTGGIGALAAACLVALAVVVWPSGSAAPPRPPAQALVAVQPNPLTVTARLTGKAWGTRIELHCTYPSYEHDRFAYDLLVIDRNHQRHVAGDWTLVPGKDGIDFTTGTSVPRSEIAQLQVRTATGTPLLELNL